MKKAKMHLLNGEHVAKRGLPEFSQILPPKLNIPTKGGEITKNQFKSDASPKRAKLRASRAKANNSLQFIKAELPKLRAAIDEGRPYNLTDNTTPTLPSTVVEWVALGVFSITLVGIETSTVLNSTTYAIPLTQSRIRAIAMAIPLMAVPAVTKCLMPPYTRQRLVLGTLALTTTLAFATKFAFVLGTALGDGGVQMLALQLVSEGFGMAAVSAIIATIVRRTATDRQRQQYAAYLKEQANLEGQVAALDTLLEGIDASETAAMDEASAVFEAEQQTLNIISQRMARLESLRRNSISHLNHQ